MANIQNPTNTVHEHSSRFFVTPILTISFFLGKNFFQFHFFSSSHRYKYVFYSVHYLKNLLSNLPFSTNDNVSSQSGMSSIHKSRLQLLLLLLLLHLRRIRDRSMVNNRPNDVIIKVVERFCDVIIRCFLNGT